MSVRKKGRMKTILSIDGGGRRGYIPAILLQHMEQRTGKRISDLFDYIAGTSTGGLLALGLAAPERYTATDMVRMYEDDLKTIFARPFLHKVKTLWGLIGPKYSSKGLTEIMTKKLNFLLLRSLTNVMVTSYDLLKRRPKFFKSWRQRDGMFAFRAAIATASAPTFFPSYFEELPGGKTYNLVDGGVFASDPSACILADVVERHPGEDILMVSLGTGRHEDGISAVNSGLLAWAKPITDVLLDGQGDSVEYVVSRHPVFAKGGFYRFQCDLPDPETRQMDGLVVPGLRRAAEGMLDEKFADVCARLMTATSQKAA